MSAQQNVLLVLTMQALLGFVQTNVTINTLEVSSRYHANIVRLACSGSEDAAVSFYYRVGGTTKNLTLGGGMVVTKEITLQIGPQDEGEYFCAIGGVRSNNSKILVGEFYANRVGGNVLYIYCKAV